MRIGFLLLSALLAGHMLLAQDSDNPLVVIDTIIIEGNKKTREAVILRELEVRKGDTLSQKELQKKIRASKSNLRNTSLFNFVDVIHRDSYQQQITLKVEVTEQWYTWVIPMFEMVDRNFNTWWQTKDLSRADIGLLFIQKNFRGRREQINFKVIGGHNEYLNLKYEVPYFDKKKRFGLMFEGEMLRSHETSVLTRSDEVVFYNDEDTYPIQKNTLNVSLLYRRMFKRKHLFSLSFQDYRFADTLSVINPDFLLKESSQAGFLSLSYEYERDYRDYISYPLTGHYLNLGIQKTGMGLVGDQVDFWRFRGYYSYYHRMSSRWYAAAGMLLSLSGEKKHPYFLKNGLGLGYAKELVRSYEYNVINGNNYGLFRSNLKYALIPTRTFKLEFLPWEQFNKVFYALYFNIFFDAGYVDPFSNWQSNGNHLPGTLMHGKGIGLDFVTYYEKVFRLEYSWNRNNEGGFFLHFVAPI